MVTDNIESEGIVEIAVAEDRIFLTNKLNKFKNFT